MCSQIARYFNLFLILALAMLIGVPRAIAQGTGTAQQLERVEVEPPQRTTSGGASFRPRLRL